MASDVPKSSDGAPDRNEEPEGVIVDAGKRLEAIRAPAFQLGLNFVQIGSDEEAQQALTYLDDHLKTEYGIRDFVDTTLSPTDVSLFDRPPRCFPCISPSLTLAWPSCEGTHHDRVPPQGPAGRCQPQARQAVKERLA